ncbi:FMN-binding protein [Streptomyces sp. J2-1]|uniref:FMN-binding protein n=1 Tax=Streptomyces corallincola TaxID=2851888 RepID=UPI001C38BB76|nr:FMN-binding protein [Streptomyces corallincola]MBV2355883.1 FMN-binding protein [Streptomyces corallincola]
MRKSHPLRRIVLATAATVSGVVLLLSLKPGGGPAASEATGAVPGASAGARESAQGGQAGGVPAGSATVTGNVVRTEYGDVQVRITVAGGRIVRADAVRAPRGGLSDTKSADAVPKLNRQAVAAGSARIDSVSGATYTSEGYKKSLQSALDRTEPAGASAAAARASADPSAPRTVTGDVVRTEYGDVQVRVTVTDGKLTRAAAVRAPQGGLSDQKTADAVPKLNARAVAAGSARIDSVSGATYTSEGYKKSLQSALDRAGG